MPFKKVPLNNREFILIFFLVKCFLGVFLTMADIHPEEVVGEIHSVRPGPGKPFVISLQEQKTWKKRIKEYMEIPVEDVVPHPSSDFFPGPVPPDAPEVVQKIDVDLSQISRHDTSRAGVPSYANVFSVWQDTGLYVPPGKRITVTVPDLPDGSLIEAVIGCHSDSLLELKEWRRFPLVLRKFVLQSGEQPLANPFGGLLFFRVIKSGKVDAQKSPVITCFVSKAVQSASFILGKDDPGSWQSRLKTSRAPWASLIGSNMVLHLPLAFVEHLKDPSELLTWWDLAVSTGDDLCGLRRLAPERVVPDAQISGGYMHAGYPFMCHLKSSGSNLVNLDKLKSAGDWGFFHELGHNRQLKSWTFNGQIEVTCNFFSLYVFEKVVGIPATNGTFFKHNWTKLYSGCMASPPLLGAFEQLAPFVKLIKSHGWAPLRSTLRSYASDPVKGMPSEEELKNEFVLRYGKFAASDMTAFFEKLGYPIEDDTRQSLRHLPRFESFDAF